MSDPGDATTSRRSLPLEGIKVLDLGRIYQGPWCGTLLALVGPRGGDAKLSEMLARWGAKLGNDLVIDREVRLFEGPRLGVIPITKTYGEHPITNNFKDYTVYPQTRTIEPSVRLRAAAANGRGLGIVDAVRYLFALEDAAESRDTNVEGDR